MFKPHVFRAQLINNICFQGPLVLTITINLIAYILGLNALKDAPHSVIYREMRRAGAYMSVLLLVWIPNFTGTVCIYILSYHLYILFHNKRTCLWFVVNILTELYPNSDLDIAMEVIVLLTALQGFFNSIGTRRIHCINST